MSQSRNSERQQESGEQKEGGGRTGELELQEGEAHTGPFLIVAATIIDHENDLIIHQVTFKNI